jgi:hypothetical protein
MQQATATKRAECHNCGKKGHIARACRNSKNRQANFISDETPDEVYTMFQVTSSTVDRKPPTVTMMVQKTKLTMEVDTGAAVTVIRENTYRYLRRKGQAPLLERSNARLWTYIGELVAIQESVTACAVRAPTGTSTPVCGQGQRTCVAGSRLASEAGPVPKQATHTDSKNRCT